MVKISYNSYMKIANIAELKNKLSAYLDLVKAGETILIMDRNRPIAKIEPTVADDSLDEYLKDMERSGLLRRGRLVDKNNDPFLRPPIKLKDGASALQALLAEREESSW